MTSFPEGWFLVKNLNNGYVLSIEKSAVGEPVVIASVRNKDIESQLWQYGEDKRLHNKKTGYVLDIAKGAAKAGSNVVLQNDTNSTDGQTFGISPEGHIHIIKNPSLVLGIKDSFFTRREGQHVHLQLVDKKNFKERKEQRWELVTPSKRHSFVGSVLSGSVDSFKRTISNASLGSAISLIHDDDDDSHLDESAHLDQFPESEFLIKSELTGHFVSIDAASLNGSGSKVCLEPLRKDNYESQLWHYDAITHRLINKGSGLAMSAEDMADEAFVSQSASMTEQDLAAQAWAIGPSGSIRLKHKPQFLLGFKKDTWFSLGREAPTNVLVQKADARVHSYQKFILALPIFKKKTTEIVSATEQIGVFPEGYFFIKNQKHGLVISVLETDKLAAHVVAAPLDSQNYNRQLWMHKDGFLINKASQFVLDVRGGCITSGSQLCQYKQKTEGYENQQWGLSVEGYIHAKTHQTMVLALDKQVGDKPSVALAHKKTPDHEEQRWNFVLPVFKHKSTTVTEKSVQKSVIHHHYAQYPSGWFFIRSFVDSNTNEAPFVLTANSSNETVSLVKVSKDEWRYQLWMHWNGVLINFATQLAVDVSTLAAGATLRQELRQASATTQKWSLTTEGYLVHGSNVALALIPERQASGDYTLVLSEQAKPEHRWGLLTPQTQVENGLQVLQSWKTTLLTECKKVKGQYVQKVVHRIADWPEDTFYISAQDGLGLVPEKLESYATVVVRKLEFGHYEQFKWSFRDGYLVHVTTGLVLHASDDLVSGSELQIRERLVTDKETIDPRQRWIVKTDGSIVSETKSNLGFSLLKQGADYHVQLVYVSSQSEHYNWGFAHGRYETRYSSVYKKDMTVLTRLERILLTVRLSQVNSDKVKVVTRQLGVFPQNWFYVRSKADSSLVLTAPDKKEGSKLTLSKIDYKIFRRQLWHVEDSDSLVNLESGYVIDVAGGALEAGSDIIQWHKKFLKRQRKNQIWGLSVDGHIRPKAHPGLVLGAKGNRAEDGVQVQLQTRGALDLEYQRWSFAIPIFGRPNGPTSVGILEGSHSDIYVESVNENSSIETISSECCERTEKITIVRRWGLFPQGGFFIRSTYGDQHLALTVERKARTDGQGRTEYEVALRPIDFKEYKWSYWTFEDGHLIHPHTGLALDATPTKGVLLEDGLQSSLFVREKSMSLYQFWSLTASGEVHLKSDQRMVIGVSSANRITVSGAQVGLRQLHVRKSVNAKGQQEASLKSESWLQWTFSKPVFGTRKTTVVQEASAAIVSAVTADDSSEQEIESFSDETLEVQESEESSDEYSPEVDSEEDEESDSEDEEESPSKQDTSALDKLNLVGNLGIATAGATILAGAATTAKPASTKVTEAPVSQVSAGVTEAREKQEVVKTGGSIAKKTSQIKREESFHLSYSYVPSGYEKVVRYKPYQKSFFPVDGYFMIKSYLHGYVLDVANNEARDGSYIVLSPIKVTNFASQLWSFRAGRLVNLKGHNLVLDASLNDTVVAGERVGLSTQKTSVGISDQHWEFDYESGVIHLAGKRNLVLSVKELEPATEKTGRIDLFIQEEKSHQKSHFARAEQRWEVLLPALVPADQTKNKTVESKYTIVEGGKVAAISSSLSAVLAFEWLKATFHHKMAHDNQWPSTENFFFVRIGNENAYLCSGSSVNDNVTFAPLGQREDHKRFLWAYVNGYLVNYKYMLRLVFDKSTNKLTLSSNTDTLNQVFSITSQGVLSLKVDSETIYFTITTTSVGKTEFQLTTCSEAESTSTQYPVQLHIPVFSNHQVEKEANVALSTITTWIHTSQKVITTTTTTTRSYRYGVFPNSTWFFIIANTKSDESLVLAAKNNSNVEGANLVLKKLSFEDYKSQLWTFRDDTLVNYGSKLVIDVHEGAIENALIKLSSESGLGTQKWSLTAEGRIYLDSYSGYTLGIRQSDTLVEETELVLLQYDESKSAQAITWRFSVPVFGKKPVSSTASMTSAIESNSSSVEEGIMIETLKEVQFKVEEVFAKKPKYTNKPAAPTKSEVVKDKQEEHHDAHDILANVGIVSGAVAAGAAVIGVASKIMDKLDVEDCEKDTKVTTLPQKKDTKKPSKKEKANTETVIVRRSKRTSAQIVQESHAIVRAWKIVFIQRIHRCTTKAQLIETIEESREELFRRLDEHLRVYTSVEHMVSGSLPQWHVSIEQVKELYRARVFERFLDRLNHEEINSAAELDFDSVVSSATEEVNRHYESVIEEQKKIQTEVATDVQGVTETSNSEVDAHEHILLTVDTIKVKTRYWLIGLYETISIAKKNGSSEEEINSIVENSRKQLSAELSEIKASTVSHIEKSSSALSAKKSSIVNTVEKAISQTETVISKQVSAVGSEKHYEVNEEYWLEVTRTSEERLSSELKVYQTAITQEVSEVQTSQISKSDQAEISVVLDEKMVSVAQETVTTKLIETKTKLTSWFTEVTQQISWILESSTSNESMKQDTLDIVNAAQIELATRIEEAKLVLRTYYAHLTYLSWAERRRIEYSLDNIKTSLTANIAHFKQSIEKQEVTKEEITRFSEYSFGATVSRVISLDVETIVSKITKVKETTTVVNTVETKKAEDNKIAIISEKKQTEAAQVDTTKVNVSKSQESQKVNVDQKTDISKAQGSQKVNVDQKSQDKVKVDQKTEDKVKVDQTKVTKIEDKKQVTEDKTSSAGGKTALTAIGAAAAAMASAAIYHHHEGKETQEKKQDSGAVVEKPDVTHANVVVGKNTETLHDQKKTNTTTKQEKSETLVAVYNQVDITVQNWLTTLNKRMIECAQKKSDNVQEEIDTIVYESQQELVVAIEKAKRTTTSVIGTSQTSFHDTLAWIRSTIWTQTAEVKRVAYEVASSSETDITVLEEKLASIKDTTLSKVTTAIEKSKSSASAIHLVGHESAATIAAGKKFEGADYSKTSHGEYVEKTKVSVGILIEETRSTIQRTLNELAISISERRKQGGENVQADVEAIMKKSREEITGYIQRSKTEFEKRITRTHQVTESSNKVEIELVNETNKKVQATLEQIQESVLVQVSKVEEVTITTTSTQVTDVKYSNKLSSACHEAYERIDASLSVSEVIIGHHVEVVAESVEHATTTTTEENKETKKVSLGVEYGLLVVAETTKSVSTQITQLIERIHHQVTSNKDTAEQDVKTFVTESNVEIDRVFDEAKTKIEYELSMVASHEKVEEEHFLAVIEDLRESAKKRVSQVHEVAITEKEETKVVSERLLQIAEESRHEISSHFKSFKESVVEKTEKVKESAHQGISVTRPSTAPTTVTHAEQEKDHESKVDLAKKVLAGSAAVAAGTAIAVEVAKKVSAHKEKVEQEEKVKQQTVEVVEDIKVQFNKWISTLTETVITQSKQSQASQEEISITIEKSKNEFLEVIQKTKTSTVITEQHQQEILSWVEQTVTSQATRIQEIVVSSSTSTVVDIESRLEVLKISTTQEVEKALEKVKDVKSSTIKFVGSTVEQLKQKESALLDVKSELSLVVHDVRASVVTFFKKFTSSVISRVQQGGDNVSKDVAILVADTRKEVTSYIENVKNTATKKLSALETKSTVSVISVAALSGIATAELISVLKKTEEILVERINNVHSTVWYVKKDQDMTEIVQKITTIETETTTEISEKIDHSHYGFVAGIAEHHQAGHIATTEVEHHDEDHLKASLTIQEVKVTIREWLRAVAEKVSICSQNGQSSEEIESVVTQETTRIFEYIDSTVIKISGHLKSEEKIQGLHSTIEKVKSTITKGTTEIKKIGVEFSGKSTGYGGFGQMSSVINEHERLISETLVIYESKTTVQKTQKQQEIKRKESQNENKRKGSQSEIKKKVETKTVVTVEYITTTIHTWLEELMVEVSEVAKREHDVAKVTNQINSIINEAKEFITIELDTVSKKVRQSKGDSAAIQELVNIIEWTRGMVLQSTTQIQQIGVNSAVSFSSTGGIDQMRPLISATETQIKVAIERCSKTIKINVECKPAYHEKYQVEKDCRKQEREKSDCDKKAKAEKKKAECEKKDKKKKAACAKKEKKKAECAKKEKKKLCDSKKETKAEESESESESESDSSSSDNDDSDSDNDRKKKAKKEIKKIVASGAVLSVSVIVREWYEQLIVDVSTRAKRGGSHVDSDIETIVKKATLTIVEKLRILSENAHNNLVDVSTVQQYRNSIEWAKNLVIQSSLQIQTIGVNSAISATSKTGGIEQMRPIIVSIQQQIDVETRRYKLISEKEKSAVQKVESKPVSSVEHKKNTEKVSNGKASVVARKEYCGKLETHISEVISESKVVVIAWYSQLIRDVSIRVHQGGNNVKKDVATIIEQSKSQLDETLKRTQKKFTSSIDVYEEDETFSVIESQIQETLQVVQKTAEKKVTQVQEITVKYQSESEVTERLSTILESSKVEVTEALDTTHKQAISVIKEETVQNESAVTIIETVEHVKSVVASWQTKLSEEIHAISIDETVHDKEEKINALVHEANTEIERVSQEAKTKISESCKSVKKISKSKQTELLTTIDYVHETFSTDVKKVQEVSVEAVKKSETNVKESISSVFESSRSKVDSFLTRTAAVVVGTAAGAVAVHAIDKKKHEKDKVEKKTGSKSEGQFSLTVRENVKAISLWFELFTQRISSSVRKQEGNVVEHITSVSKHAEQEISEIIAAARTDFVKRLSHENMDKEAYDYAVKHYEESLESAHMSILTEVTEVKKVAIEAHKAGKIEVLDIELNKLVKESTERITIAMGSSVSITHKAQSGKNSSASEGSVLHIEVEDDKEVVGEQNVEFERKEESVNVSHEEKAKKEKHDSNLEKVVAGSLAVGATAGAAVSIHEKNKKDQKKSEKQTVEKYESGVAAIENVQVTISEWFKTLVQKVSHASKSGASSEQIIVIVQESRTELTQLIDHVKAAGAAHCTSASDEQQFVSKIEWVSSVAQAQAVQIQQIGINASVSKSDLTSQMESLATASFHQIEVTLEQMKTSINFHQKINKISGKKSVKKAEQAAKQKVTTAVDKTKAAYGVVQETRVATVALLVSLSESIVTRIRHGGVSVEEDVHKIVETAEKEVTKIFEKSKRSSTEIDEKTRLQVENALTTVHKTVEEQITQIKTVTVQSVNSSASDSESVIGKVLEISKSSTQKVETEFTSVSETITTSLTVVSQTAQKTTESVQSWFSELNEKIMKLMDAGDCTAEEVQKNVDKAIAEAQVEMNTNITKIQKESTASENKSGEISSDHHLDVFFGNIKSSMEKQLNEVKTTVKGKSKIDKIILEEVLKTSQAKLKAEIDSHNDAVKQVTSVDHITGTQQQVDSQIENNRHDLYKDTIEKVAVGTAAVAAAAAAAIGFHKKSQKSEATSVEVINESSIQTVHVKVDTWFSTLTERVISRTKQGGQNVSADISEIVKSAQNELEVIINELKTEHKNETYVASDSRRTFSCTLEWIKTTAITQSTQIIEIVNHSSSSSIDLATQIENHISVTKQQIDGAFEVHKKTESSVTVKSSEEVKLTKEDADASTSVDVVSKDQKHENVVQIVTETREQTQKRISLETTVIVQERKTEITNWLVLLMESLTTIIHSHSDSIRRDIFTRLELAEKEIETYVQDTKQRFLSITSSSANSKVDAETQKLAVNSIKQSLDCIENIKATLIIQISVIREIITRIEVEDITVITERLHAVIDRAQQRVHHTLDSGIELAITSAFEGKVVTWTETATIPQSFKNVRVIAYDLAGSVVDYRKSLYKVWKRIITPKNDIVLSTMDFNAFVRDWFGAYTEVKQENYRNRRVVSDDVCLHEALVHILKRFYVKDSFNEAEIEELCDNWRKVGTYDDASIGIRRIKSQTAAKYATIAISDSFSTRTMIELAQSNCLCWHAQFSYDMFAAEASTASESLVKGTIGLLGLAHANELAIVSTNHQLISAAKKNGCHAVLIEREEQVQQQVEYDVKVDGLDVFGESVQSFLEHESMVQVWNDKDVPSTPTVWAQKIKGVFN